MSKPKINRIQLRQHYLDIAGFEKKESMFVKVPGEKELVDISFKRKRNNIQMNNKKFKAHIREMCQKLGITPEEYGKRLTIIHTHRFDGSKKKLKENYPLTLFSIADFADFFANHLIFNTKKEISVLYDINKREPMGYTFISLREPLLGILKKLKIKASTLKPFLEQKNGLALYSEFLLAIDEYENNFLKRLRKKDPNLDSSVARYLLAQELGINLRFLAEENYYLDKNDLWFHKKS